jgi:hypothetical protein
MMIAKSLIARSRISPITSNHALLRGLELRGHGAKLPRKAVKILPGPSFLHFQKATESGAVIRGNRASTPRGHASPITLTVIGFPACTVRESHSRQITLVKYPAGVRGAQNPSAAQAACRFKPAIRAFVPAAAASRMMFDR